MSFVADADIAQSVERILGKDEVASSNLANSSIVLPLETGRFKRFLYNENPTLGVGFKST